MVERWFTDRKKLWWQVVKDKYDLKANLNLDQCRDIKDLSSMVKYICLVNESMDRVILCSKSIYQWVVGDGREVLFWKDNWNSIGVLTDRFSRDYIYFLSGSITLLESSNIFGRMKKYSGDFLEDGKEVKKKRLRC